MTWQSPIYDRTEEDVETAIDQISKWALEENPSTQDLKGCINASDLNRIDENIQFLFETLNTYGYPSYVNPRAWNRRDLFTQIDLQRICSDIKSLIQSYYQTVQAPTSPENISTIQEVNDAERNIYLLKYLINAMENSFPKCGTFACGQSFRLPLRRT